jgi:chaperone protein EcpD
MKKTVCALSAGLLMLCLGFGSAQASVVIGGTRVVFPAQDGEVTLRLSNNGERPALVEAWIDRGDPHSTPDKVDTPFLITPPLFRMEAHKDQSLRILFTQSAQPLPTDRESVFWLNVLEIPPKPNGKQFVGKNYMQLAIRSRLKLFYRPAGLAGDVLKAPAELGFKTVTAGAGQALLVHNPTPYYITISQIAMVLDGKSYKVDTGMVAPLSDLRLDVPQLQQTPAAGSPIRFDTINDYGAAVTLKSTVSP